MKIKRRDVIAGVGATAFTFSSRAQPVGQSVRIAVMTNAAESDLDEQSRVAVFREELARLGWLSEKNTKFEYRWTAASIDLANKYAVEIVGMKPDVILVVGTTTVSIMLEHTRSIPIVFVTGADPVKAGFITSFAKPGGNATGFVDLVETISGKWLQILKEMAPMIVRVIVLYTDSQATRLQLPSLEDSAAILGIKVLPVNVHNATEIEQALASHAGDAQIGLIVLPSSIASLHRAVIIAQAARHKFPAMYPNRRYPAEGGLMSYAADRVVQYRRSASYVDLLLKGAKPTDLPARLQEKFDLVLNAQTAKALGLMTPLAVLERGVELIE
jgi:putative tryptophan/tyrosine transport system substrate-binding protein